MVSFVARLIAGIFCFDANAATEEPNSPHRTETPDNANAADSAAASAVAARSVGGRADTNGVSGSEAQGNSSKGGLRGHDIDAHALIIGINGYQAGLDSKRSGSSGTPIIRDGGTESKVANSGPADTAKPSPIENLRGATVDALRMKEFLVHTHSVKPENIDMLTDSSATRAGIIAAIEKLGQPANGIENGGAIIIYYAGHGGRIKMAVPWDTQRHEVEVLVPYDAEVTASSVKNVIPDYKIRQLLEDLSKAKGDNITVIFDCCHSAGLDRGVDQDDATNDEDVLVRRIEFPAEAELDTAELHGARQDEVLPYLKSHLQQADKTKSSSEESGETIFRSHYGSHILLAACSQHQRAHEKADGGFFTRALLDILESPEYKRASKTYTYNRIMTMLASQSSLTTHQTPYCSGMRKNRYLFSRGAELYHPLSFPVSLYTLLPTSPDKQCYEIRGAGMLDILTGGTFAVYPFRNIDALIKGGPTTSYLCVLNAIDTTDARRITALPNGSPGPAASVLSSAIAVPVPRDFPIYVPKLGDLPSEAQAGLLHIHEAIRMAWYGVQGIYNLAIKLVERKEDAMFAFELSSENITMVILDKDVCDLARTTEGLPVKTVSLEDASPRSFISIIRRAVCFFHRLRQAPTTAQGRTLGPKVEMDIRQIKYLESDDDDADNNTPCDSSSANTSNVPPQTSKTSSKNLIARSKEERQSDPLPLWQVSVNDFSHPGYGIELHDKRGRRSAVQGPIYPTLFYFDCHTLEISLLYEPLKAAQNGVGGKGDGALTLKESLRLNFGEGYGEHLRFQLDQGRDVEAGFLRLFLATTYTDLSRFCQPGISVDAEQGDDEPGNFRHMAVSGPSAEVAKWWDTVTLPVRLVR